MVRPVLNKILVVKAPRVGIESNKRKTPLNKICFGGTAQISHVMHW